MGDYKQRNNMTCALKNHSSCQVEIVYWGNSESSETSVKIFFFPVTEQQLEILETIYWIMSHLKKYIRIRCI